MRSQESFEYGLDVSGEGRPFNKVLRSLLLVAVGLACFIGGIDLVVTQNATHGFAFIVLGVLVFLPGVYFAKVAYYAYKGYRGVHFSHIPDV